MEKERRALVVGAGVGGLGAATALARRGFEVDVVEIRDDDQVAGVGINQPGNALRALDDLGVLEQCLSAGFAFDRNTHCDWHGRPLVETPCALGTERVPPNNGLSRARLHRILGAAAREAGARVRHGVTVADLDDSGTEAAVGFSDGGSSGYDVVAAFDGIRSPMRRRLFGEAHEPEYTGFAVWRAVLPRPEAITHTMLFHGDRSNTGVIPLSQEQMYLLHVAAEPQGVRHDPTDLRRLLRRRLAGYEGLVAELRDRLPGRGIIFSPLHEVHLPPPWHRGRVIVLGDAAHASAPNLTQGAAMALEDAVVLADELDGERPVVQSLAAVTELRLPRTRLVQEVSHRILVTEMAVTAEDLPRFAAGLRQHLPAQAAAVEAVLNQPYRRPDAGWSGGGAAPARAAV